MTTKIVKNLKKVTEHLDEGLTVTTWSDENYGYLRIYGLIVPGNVEGRTGVGIDLTFSTWDRLPLLADAIDRLYQERPNKWTGTMRE